MSFEAFDIDEYANSDISIPFPPHTLLFNAISHISLSRSFNHLLKPVIHRRLHEPTSWDRLLASPFLILPMSQEENCNGRR